MKLVRIEHIRCDEYSATTFVFAPDEWDGEMIESRARAAQDAYLAAVAVGKAQGKRPPWPKHNVKDYPDEMTVAEAKAEYERQEKAVREWDEARRQTAGRFADFLKEEGFTPLWSVPADLSLDWGHRHGQPLDYENTDTDTLPTPGEVAGQPPLDPFDL